ncbi:MAG: alpha/beta hydrolase [Deltaproteobacteria bacterium]
MNWLLLRGLAREQRHWGGFVDVLARATNGDTVHRLDLPGTGTEHLRNSPLSVPAIGEDVRARWLALRAQNPGPWGVLGISLGGMVALAWAGAYPRDFERLVVVNSSAGDLNVPWQRMRLDVFGGVLQSLRDRSEVGRERRVLAMTTRIFADVDARATEWATYMRDRPMRRANVGRQILAATRFRSPSRIDVPLLVLSGAGDALADPACSRAIAARYGARHEQHPAAGHDMSTDAPEWLAERVRDWMAAA